MIRLLVTLLLACALVAPLAGCGKKGDPEAPEKEEVRYPRQYPKAK